MKYSDEELAQKLVKISDQEIEIYHAKRKRQYKILYLLGLICGIVAIIFIILNIVWITIVLGIIGIILVQTGRYQRIRWIRIYNYLMNLRKHQQNKEQQSTMHELTSGKKYQHLK